MPPLEKDKQTLWPWVFLALGMLLASLSLGGVLGSYSPAFLENPTLFSMLCALALLPGLAYAWTLKRGKSASHLRSPYAPFVLFGLAHLSVQLSGGFQSPLRAAYALLLFEVSAFTPLSTGLGIAGLATLLDLPLLLRGLAP